MSADVESLLGEIERSADPSTRERVRELVRALLLMHRQGLERLLASVPDGVAAARDPLVSGLLLLHDLHPLSLEQRVHAALANEAFRAVAIDGEVVRVVVSSGRERVEALLAEAAPEATVSVVQEALVPVERLVLGARRA